MAALTAESIMQGLGTRLIGRRVLYYPSLTSTMNVAREEAQRGAPEGTVVITDEQTAGRGRLKRAWLSPGGNIALSVVLRPDRSCLPSLIMLASLAVVHSIESVTGIKAQIKWPNDVLVNGRKLCGILIESVQGSRVNYAIVGIGINVNLRLADIPEIQTVATSLSDELGREVSRLDMVLSLLAEMESLYLVLSNGGSLYEAWRDNLVTLGEEVRVGDGDSVYQGIAESVGRDGSLLLRRQDGNLTRIITGDIVPGEQGVV